MTRCCYSLKRCACCGCCFDEESASFYLASEDVEDEDVLAERNACETYAKRSVAQGRAIDGTDEETGGEAQSAVFLHRVKHAYRAKGKQRFEGTVAVQDLSLRIRKKECFSLLGTNGAGKTTILNMIMRQITVQSGIVEVNGIRVGVAANDLFKGMGFCPQQNALLQYHTTKELLMFYARIRGVPEKEMDEYCEKWMMVTRLSPFRDTACGRLSGGNKRKLSLAIAILGNPSLAVLDEPSAGVDPASRKKLHRLINAVKIRGATIILTTHRRYNTCLI